MEKIFATKIVAIRTAYYFNGFEITDDLVMSLSGAHYWKMCTPERIIAAGIEVRAIETPTLVATTPQDYSGPGLPRFNKEEGGYVYFHKQYGDRPAGFELRARVAEQIGEIVVLHEWERRDFHRNGHKPEHETIYRNWSKINLDGKSFSCLVW